MANRRRFTGDPSRLPPLLYQANRLGVCTDRVALGVDSTWAASRPTGPRPRAGRSGCGQGASRHSGSASCRFFSRRSSRQPRRRARGSSPDWIGRPRRCAWSGSNAAGAPTRASRSTTGVTRHQRVLDLLRTEPGLTSEEIRVRLIGPRGTVSAYQPVAALTELRESGLVVADGNVPERYFPVALVHGNAQVDRRPGGRLEVA